MSHTRRKLAEATFFHSRFVALVPTPPPMLPITDAPPPPLPEEAGYYLNAFVSSARSVLLVMHWEYVKVPGWKEWFAAKEANDEEQALLKLFTNLRNTSQKQKPITPEQVPMLVGNLVPVSSLPESPFGDQPPPGDGTWHVISYNPPAGVIWFTVVEQKEILGSCQHYLTFLERVITECEQRFGVPVHTP